MPSNDTENIYSSPLGSGTPSTPPTAEEVSYDNDLSQLTATNVQDAIDEVAEVTTKTSNHMLLKPSGSSILNYNIDVTTDGVKTWAEVLHDLYTAFHAIVTAIPNGTSRIKPASIFIQGYGGFLSTYTSGFTSATVNDTSYYEGAHVVASGVYACNIQLGETSTFVEWLIDGTATTRTLKTTDVPNSGIHVYLNYELYDKV